MSTFMQEAVTCAVCGNTSKFNVLTSTNSFGSPDLDLRPAQMQRSTMWLWVQKCPHCNYVGDTVSDITSLTEEYFSSEEYLKSENISFPCDLADNFYKLYMIKKISNEYEDAYFALLHCAWACDDYGKKDLSCLIRQKMIDIFDKLSDAFKSNKNRIAQYVDVLRRCGKFDTIIEKFADYKSTDEIIDNVIKFQVELAKKKDDSVYTVSHALKD